MLLEPAINANTILQAIGRVHRLGQKQRQEIDILFVDHTFNRHVEHNQASHKLAITIPVMALNVQPIRYSMHVNVKFRRQFNVLVDSQLPI